MPRLCFALDLQDDPALIARYEAMHATGAVWPEVTNDLRARGVEAMEIWRTGDRLLMIAEVTEDYPRDCQTDARVEQWEALMSSFQRALPHAAPGEKWVPMIPIFRLADQS